MDAVIFLHDCRVEAGMIRTNGDAFIGPDGIAVPWSAVAPTGTAAVVINNSIADAVIAAAAGAGLTVGPADQKTLIAGAALL